MTFAPYDLTGLVEPNPIADLRFPVGGRYAWQVIDHDPSLLPFTDLEVPLVRLFAVLARPRRWWR